MNFICMVRVRHTLANVNGHSFPLETDITVLSDGSAILRTEATFFMDSYQKAADFITGCMKAGMDTTLIHGSSDSPWNQEGRQ